MLSPGRRICQHGRPSIGAPGEASIRTRPSGSSVASFCRPRTSARPSHRFGRSTSRRRFRALTPAGVESHCLQRSSDCASSVCTTHGRARRDRDRAGLHTAHRGRVRCTQPRVCRCRGEPFVFAPGTAYLSAGSMVRNDRPGRPGKHLLLSATWHSMRCSSPRDAPRRATPAASPGRCQHLRHGRGQPDREDGRRRRQLPPYRMGEGLRIPLAPGGPSRFTGCRNRLFTCEMVRLPPTGNEP